jgi:hypothetical protein
MGLEYEELTEKIIGAAKFFKNSIRSQAGNL